MPILNTFILNITHLQFILSAFLLLLFIFKQSIFTYLHELGHLFALWITNDRLKLNYKISLRNIHVYRNKHKTFKRLFPYRKGKTQNKLYEYLELNKNNEKISCYIRFNAISGFAFTILILGNCLLHIVFSCLCLNLKILLGIPFTMFILFETINFFLSSDFKNFKCPKYFHQNHH